MTQAGVATVIVGSDAGVLEGFTELSEEQTFLMLTCQKHQNKE
jgi:hypothetical protein